MHEWALADGVISTAVSVAKDNDAKKIVRINIKIGELQQIDKEIFEEALEDASNNTMAENSEIVIEKEDAILECKACEEKWNYEDSKTDLSDDEEESIHFLPNFARNFVRCPNCDSPDFEILEGRGVWVDSVELED